MDYVTRTGPPGQGKTRWAPSRWPPAAGMAVPMMISMLVQALYNIVDSVFVAQLSENALTAVSLAFPLQNLMIAVCARHHGGYERPALPLPGGQGAGPGRPGGQHRHLPGPGLLRGLCPSSGPFSPGPSSCCRPTWRRLWTTAPTMPGCACAAPSACSASSPLSGCSSPPGGPTVPVHPDPGGGDQHRPGPHPHLRPAGLPPAGGAGGRHRHRGGPVRGRRGRPHPEPEEEPGDPHPAQPHPLARATAKNIYPHRACPPS